MAESVSKRISAFPADFLWGAGVSAYQVEGGNHNDWTVWELAHATELASKAEERWGKLVNWPAIKEQATNPANYVSDIAVDHFHRYKEDFRILKQLNLNAFRTGIEWSRLEPEEGKWNEEAFQHYHTYLKELSAQCITPIVTLWHQTLPVWFAEKGGFAKRKNLKYFTQHIQKVGEKLGHDMKYVIVMNEPNMYTWFSYYVGENPPQVKSFWTSVKVYLNLIQAYKESYRILKKIDHTLQIGTAHHIIHLSEGDEKWTTRFWVRFRGHQWNWFFLRRARGQMDFVGMNYYHADTYFGKTIKNPNKKLSDMGWDMQPQLIEEVLKQTYQKTRKPILITENGVADSDDAFRRWWLEGTLRGIQRALRADVPVIGYIHWSLLDNFEWTHGFWPKFGLVAIDRKTMKRIIRPNARWFARVIRGITPTAEKPEVEKPHHERVEKALKHLGYRDEKTRSQMSDVGIQNKS